MNNRTIQRFIPYFKPYRGILFTDLFFAALTTVCELAFPLIFRQLTNLGLQDAGQITITMIGQLGGTYLVLRIVEIFATYYMQNIGHVMGARIEKDMRRDLFSHLQTLSDNFYNNTKVGQIMTRITADLNDITEFAHHCPEEFFIAGIKILISFIILLRINLPLTLIIYTLIPMMIYFASSYRRQLKRSFMDQRHHIGELNAGIEDSLLGVRVVKSFANEEVEKQKFEEGNEEFLSIKKRTYKNMAGFSVVNRLFDGLMNLSVLIIGGFFLMNGTITAGDLVAYVLYVTTLLATVRRIIEFTEQFQRGMTGIERFLEIMDIKSDIVDAPDAVELGEIRGEITFDNVSFQYLDHKEWVLKDIDLEIKPGQNIAIVGPSGGGKTTLCNLIPRLYDVTEGAIRIDGIDIRDIQLKSLREKIGMVQQDVYLFSDSVFDNIEYGKPGASREEVHQAAKLAGAYEFIMDLPEGFDTYVGERGVKLSGGQKQRISIARVFLKNPPILILDEATSALDNTSEKLVQKSLEQLAKGRTTLTIAHRLSTIRNADTIVVLTDDGIEEIGNHEELLAQKGMYYELHRLGSEWIGALVG
ncbi:MAG: ABC transporter ATP-binding protein [Tissierellia bacterium]|nr:ABC transporter ATP-binding protein [Tissierellia bacterium]